MEFRKMVMITLYARQQKRHRCIAQSFGLCGRGRGWDDLGPRDLTQVSCIADRFFTIWATWEISYLYLLHSKRDFKIKDTHKISFLGDLLTTYIPASVSLFCNLHNLKLNRLENSYTHICVCIYIYIIAEYITGI